MLEIEFVYAFNDVKYAIAAESIPSYDATVHVSVQPVYFPEYLEVKEENSATGTQLAEPKLSLVVVIGVVQSDFPITGVS